MQALLDKLTSGDSAVSAMLWIGLGLLLLIVVIAIALWLIRALRPALNMSSNTARGGRVQVVTYPSVGHVRIVAALAAPFTWMLPVRQEIVAFVTDPR